MCCMLLRRPQHSIPQVGVFPLCSPDCSVRTSIGISLQIYADSAGAFLLSWFEAGLEGEGA